MEIVFAAGGVNIGVAGVFLFGALMMGLQSTSTAFLLCKPHNSVLGDGITPSCCVEKLKAILPPQGIGVLPASFYVPETA